MTLLCCYDSAFRLQWDSDDDDSILLHQKPQQQHDEDQQQHQHEDHHHQQQHKQFDATDLALDFKDRSLLEGFADATTTCYSFGYDSDFVRADDTVDEFHEYVNVDDAAAAADYYEREYQKPPVRLISFPVNENTFTTSTWSQITDYVPCDYHNDDDDDVASDGNRIGYPRLKVKEPLTRQEKRAMKKLLTLLTNETTLNSTDSTVSDSPKSDHQHHVVATAAANNNNFKAGGGGGAGADGDFKENSLKMVEIYKDPFTGRSKTKIHHIVDVGSGTTSKATSAVEVKRRQSRLLSRMHLNTISSLLQRSRSQRVVADS